jgi:hypothetical protein
MPVAPVLSRRAAERAERDPASHRSSARRCDDVQAEPERAIGVRKRGARDRRSIGATAALVVGAFESIDRAVLCDGHGDHVAERLQLPAERAHRLAGGRAGDPRQQDDYCQNAISRAYATSAESAVARKT